MYIALIADTHLSQHAPECVANWRAAACAVAAEPDLTIAGAKQSRPRSLNKRPACGKGDHGQ